MKLNIWQNYSIKLCNAKSNGSIFPNYQYSYQSDDFDLILIMADTDRPAYNDFIKLMKKIDDFHGVQGYANEIIIFGNPCTMQFILNHFSTSPVFVTKANKKKNSDLINQLTGINNYDAHENQRKLMFEK